MVKRKLPKTELRRYIRDTPFTRDEVQKLWNRFNKMDMDGTGQLNYQVYTRLPERSSPLSSLAPCHKQLHAAARHAVHTSTACI